MIDLFIWILLNLDAKLFKERRSESKELLQIIKVEDAYERKYKLLEGAYEKLLSVRPSMLCQNSIRIKTK